MPTNYTAKIKDGQSFEGYALGCAKAFGACITLRDESSDAAIPEKFEPSDYHIKALVDAKNNLSKLTGMSEPSKDSAVLIANSKAIDEHKRMVNESNDLRTKYLIILNKVELWTAPTEDHEKFKSFMREQIQSSIEWDCHDYDYDEPVKLTVSEWYKAELDRAERSVEYHAEEHTKEIERVNNRNQWVKQLRDSLV